MHVGWSQGNHSKVGGQINLEMKNDKLTIPPLFGMLCLLLKAVRQNVQLDTHVHLHCSHNTTFPPLRYLYWRLKELDTRLQRQISRILSSVSFFLPYTKKEIHYLFPSNNHLTSTESKGFL